MYVYTCACGCTCGWVYAGWCRGERPLAVCLEVSAAFTSYVPLSVHSTISSSSLPLIVTLTERDTERDAGERESMSEGGNKWVSKCMCALVGVCGCMLGGVGGRGHQQCVGRVCRLHIVRSALCAQHNIV